MARKSRKKTGSAVCVSTSPAVKPFSTAIYARLSVENSGKNDDGDSIENQVSICREYIEERKSMPLSVRISAASVVIISKQVIILKRYFRFWGSAL